MKLSWIVFDLSGIVLTDGLAAVAPDIAARLGIDPESFKRYVVGPNATAYRTGDESPEVFWKRFETDFPGIDSDYVKKEFFDAYKMIPDAATFIKRLTPNYKLASFSYSPPDRAQYLSDKYNFERLFQKSLYGTDLSDSKFNTSAYTKLAKILNSAPDQVLMIDDRPEFTKASSEAGLPTILFTDFKTLETQLEDFGVLLK
jgi:beta-phosphoglucomutase-like phosphatase (HAD superfamily)